MAIARIAAEAAASRVAVLVWAVVANLLIPDHEAEGVRLWHAETFRESRVLQTFTRWDSAQFLEIAELGYSEEPSFAFFPGYPILIRAVNRTILPETALFGSSSTPFLSGYSIQERLVLSGLLISNVAFVAAALAIYALTLAALDDATTASNAARMWCLSPANIFFSTVYTESLFAALCFAGMGCWIAGEFTALLPNAILTWNILKRRTRALKGRRGVVGSLQQLLAVLLCTGSAAVRSNGAFTAALPLWYGGIAVLRVLSSTSALVSVTKESRASKTASPPPSAAALGVPGFGGVVTIMYAIAKAMICCAIIWAPVFAFQEYGTARLCGASHERGSPLLDGLTRAGARAGLYSAAGGSSHTPGGTSPAAAWVKEATAGVLDGKAVPPTDPAWCTPSASGAPATSLYQHIQRKHWNVGFLRYYELKQIPNFLLASPIAFLTYFGLCNYARFWGPRLLTRSKGRGGRVVAGGGTGGGVLGSVANGLARLVRAHDQRPRGAVGDVGILGVGAMPFMLMWGVLTVMYVLVINVQVVTRLLLASCPPAVWWLAEAWGSWSGRRRQFLVAYMVVFNVVGVAMHVNFLPWT